MIHITITPESLSVIGHARAAPYGQDIVCAGVSVLVQTFSAAALAFTKDAVKVVEEPGRAVYSWARDPTKELTLLIDALYMGLRLMAESYPDYIAVTCTR